MWVQTRDVELINLDRFDSIAMYTDLEQGLGDGSLDAELVAESEAVTLTLMRGTSAQYKQAFIRIRNGLDLGDYKLIDLQDIARKD